MAGWTDFVVAVLGVPFGAALDLLDGQWTARSVALVFALGLVVAGHVDRRIERARFHVTLRLHGFADHGEYVASHYWKGRRRRFIAEHRRPPCRICARTFEPDFPIHHRDYARAGDGQERNRDLWMLCERCHVWLHKRDRKRGLFRHLGFSLRLTSWLVCFWWLPVRVARRSFGDRRVAAP